MESRQERTTSGQPSVRQRIGQVLAFLAVFGLNLTTALSGYRASHLHPPSVPLPPHYILGAPFWLSLVAITPRG